MACYKVLHLLFALVYFIAWQQQCLAMFTYGLEADRLCQEYKKVCPRNKVCAIQTIHIHHEMKFPVCVHKTNLSMLLSACEEAPNAGRCGAQFRRWYFNVHTASCSWFTYSGCGGNRNNFRSREECEVTCINQQTNGDRKEINPEYSDIQQGSLFYNHTGQATEKKPQLKPPFVHSSDTSNITQPLYKESRQKNTNVHDVNKNSHTTPSFVFYNMQQRKRSDSFNFFQRDNFSETSNNARTKKLSSQRDLKGTPKTIDVAKSSFMEYRENPVEYDPLNETYFPSHPTYTEIHGQRNTLVKKKIVSNFNKHSGKINDTAQSNETNQSIYGSNYEQQLIKTPLKSAYAPAAIEKVWRPSEKPKSNRKPVRKVWRPSEKPKSNRKPVRKRQRNKRKQSGKKRLHLPTNDNNQHRNLPTNDNNQHRNFDAKRKNGTLNTNETKIYVIFKKHKPYEEIYKGNSEINTNVKKKRKRKRKLIRKTINEDKLSSSTIAEMHTTALVKNQYYDQIQLFGLLERKENATIVPFN